MAETKIANEKTEKVVKEKKAAKPKAEKVAKVTQAFHYDPWNVLLYPSMSEKSIRMIEVDNKIVFIVRQNATKAQIKKAFENAFSVKVKTVTTLLDQDSNKKAFIKLSKEFLASDIATRLGII